MSRRGNRKKPPAFQEISVHSETGGLLKPSAFSLLVHIVLVVFVMFSLRSATLKNGPSVYRVTLEAIYADWRWEHRRVAPGVLDRGLPTSPPAEKLKPVESPKETDITEGIKRPEKKQGGRLKNWRVKGFRYLLEKEKPHTERDRRGRHDEGQKDLLRRKRNLEMKKQPSQSLQEALEDIRKKAALDEIQKKVAQRDGNQGKWRREGDQRVVHLRTGRLLLEACPGQALESGTGTGSGTEQARVREMGQVRVRGGPPGDLFGFFGIW